MKKQFLVVQTIGISCHIIDLNLIKNISPKGNIQGLEYKSEISFIAGEISLYSTETPLEIFEKIKILQQE